MLNFSFPLPLAKLDIVSLRQISNGSIFLDDIEVNIQLLTFLLLSDIKEITLGAKIRKF